MARNEEPPELLESMHGHVAECRHCGGVVKMMRSEQGELAPDHCHCFGCGQRYYMEIEDVAAWEVEQWEQKLGLT